MENSIILVIISPAVSLVILTLGYVLTRKREREADWRKKKLEMYHQLFDAISGLAGGENDITVERITEFAKAHNTIGLIAPPEVIELVYKLRLCLGSEHNSDQDQVLTDLLQAIRNDIKLPLPESFNFKYKLMRSGYISQTKS